MQMWRRKSSFAISLQSEGRLHLTSGEITSVPDGRAGQHSPFARRFIASLRTYGGKAVGYGDFARIGRWERSNRNEDSEISAIQRPGLTSFSFPNSHSATKQPWPLPRETGCRAGVGKKTVQFRQAHS